MSKPEEFKIHIDDEGRIRMDFRGMKPSSYRRIIEMLEETVGPVSIPDLGEDEPPRVLESHQEKTDASEETQHIRGKNRG